MSRITAALSVPPSKPHLSSLLLLRGCGFMSTTLPPWSVEPAGGISPSMLTALEVLPGISGPFWSSVGRLFQPSSSTSEPCKWLIRDWYGVLSSTPLGSSINEATEVQEVSLYGRKHLRIGFFRKNITHCSQVCGSLSKSVRGVCDLLQPCSIVDCCYDHKSHFLSSIDFGEYLFTFQFYSQDKTVSKFSGDATDYYLPGRNGRNCEEFFLKRC